MLADEVRRSRVGDAVHVRARVRVAGYDVAADDLQVAGRRARGSRRVAA